VLPARSVFGDVSPPDPEFSPVDELEPEALPVIHPDPMLEEWLASWRTEIVYRGTLYVAFLTHRH